MLAAEVALAVTGDARWQAVMEQAYGSFLGRKDLGIPVADPERGACYDGLMPDGVNLNQGAESTLMWLTALEHVHALRAASGRTPTSPRTPAMASVA